MLRKNCTRKLTASSSGCCFSVQKSAKKIRKNKNSVYWMIENVEKSKKQKEAKKTRKIKNKKNRKKIEKESERLEAVRLRSAPKAP